MPAWRQVMRLQILRTAEQKQRLLDPHQLRMTISWASSPSRYIPCTSTVRCFTLLHMLALNCVSMLQDVVETLLGSEIVDETGAAPSFVGCAQSPVVASSQASNVDHMCWSSAQRLTRVS